MGKLAGIIAGIVAIGAGAYLIGTQSAADNSIFNPLLHGIGAYFVARGLWMLAHAGQRDDTISRLDKLVSLVATRHVADRPPVD